MYTYDQSTPDAPIAESRLARGRAQQVPRGGGRTRTRQAGNSQTTDAQKGRGHQQPSPASGLPPGSEFVNRMALPGEDAFQPGVGTLDKPPA